MPNLPKWPHELVDTEEYDETEVAWQGTHNPCDGCGCYHYTEETACTIVDASDVFAGSEEQPQHCQCWYDCDPCCKCSDQPNVLHGPVRSGGRQ